MASLFWNWSLLLESFFFPPFSFSLIESLTCPASDSCFLVWDIISLDFDSYDPDNLFKIKHVLHLGILVLLLLWLILFLLLLHFFLTRHCKEVGDRQNHLYPLKWVTLCIIWFTSLATSDFFLGLWDLNLCMLVPCGCKVCDIIWTQGLRAPFLKQPWPQGEQR